LLAILSLPFLVSPAFAVIVRGKVTTPLGVPLPGARVQLIRGPRSVADTISSADGSYEIRTDLIGRFVLLTSASVTAKQAAVQISPLFYGGRTDDLRIDVALDPGALTPRTSALPTQRATPLAQLAVSLSQVAADQLLTREGLAGELAEQTPAAVVIRNGETGTPEALYLRGAAPETLKLVVDGVSAERLGGGFDLSRLSTSGVAAVAPGPAFELAAGPAPLLPIDAEAGVLAVQSAASTVARGWAIVLAGDAGGLDTEREDVQASYAHDRFDSRAGFTRFDTANSIPASPYHRASENADLGYQISGNTSLRLTLRNDVSASALVSPFDFFGVAPAGKLAAQTLVSGGTFATRTGERWQHQVRFGMMRDRQQTYNFATPASGLPVTITGANGYRVSGTATFDPLPAREDRVTNRDEYSYQTTYDFSQYARTLLTARYQDERAAHLLPATLALTEPSVRLERTHLSFAGGVQGDLRHRVFYEAAGLVDFGNEAGGPLTHALGLRGAPRVGLSWAPVRPGVKAFRGTTLHLTAATGFREPTLDEQVESPTARTLARSRVFDAGIEQNLVHEKLVARATYFHSQFAHQAELLVPETATTRAQLSDQLAYLAQGLETTLRYTPRPRLFLNGGYTYLAALVEQSATMAVFNPAFGGVPIGATSALVGARPFHRPPHSGFLGAEYSGKGINAAIKASFAGRSDDSTALTLNPGLLLPNRNLSPGFLLLDANFLYSVNRRISLYTQFDNLTDNRHLAPIGYLSTPFQFRTGLRIRFGRE
jgi:iron complex outermembrane receptor protein/vitamin B12 transporter